MLLNNSSWSEGNNFFHMINQDKEFMFAFLFFTIIIYKMPQHLWEASHKRCSIWIYNVSSEPEIYYNMAH